MRISLLFGKTLRDDPADAEIASHRLMVRAGLINQIVSGVYSYLPLAWRSVRKIENIIREEMDAAGAQELRLPALQPQDIWDKSGRNQVFGEDMFRLSDRRDRPLVIAPTHEEALTNLVAANVSSYRDLPITLYQIQTKFRDEPRPRAGLIRVREFDMKDAYSFDDSEHRLDASYTAMREAYKRIYRRCGVSAIMVEADSGAIGGKDSQEFMALANAGEDTIIFCESCKYAANVEIAKVSIPADKEDAPNDLKEVSTPGVKTIEDLTRFFNIPARKTLKAVFYWTDGEVVVATIRGDLEVNMTKLSNALEASDIRLATPDEIASAGLVAGSASPVGLDGIRKIADYSIEFGTNFVVGANVEGRHLQNTNYPRDFEVDKITDIALAEEGLACEQCHSPLETRRGIEVGHIFKLGTRYSELLGAYFSDADDKQRPITMGCYGIGVGRLLAAAIEQNHDENGIIFPVSIAPYQVWLTALNVEKEEVAEISNQLYETLTQNGVDALYDDRPESAGVKFKDADLIGLPIRIVVSTRNIKQGIVEIKLRSRNDVEPTPINEVVARIKELALT